VLSETHFFPDLQKQSREEKINALKKFLRPVRISDEQQSWLSACHHVITAEKRSAWPKIVTNYRGNVVNLLTEAHQDSCQAGDFGFAVASLLQEARDIARNNSGNISDVVTFAEDADTLIKNQEDEQPLTRVAELCRKYNGTFCAKTDLCIPGFNLGGLEKAIQTLVRNSEGKIQPTVRLNCTEQNNRICIELLAHWDNLNINIFKEKVMCSLEKGAHRGLPYALLFGLLYGADGTEYRIDTTWHLLDGTAFSTAKGKNGNETEFNHGVRWSFSITNSSRGKNE
jgi:transcriptional regulator of acetoin/glycerol metabolism